MAYAPLRRLAKLGWWTISFQLPRRVREKRALREIAESGLFDEAFYRAANPDLDTARVDPITHYLRHGAAEGRDPSAHFHTRFYVERYPDVAAAGVNPLVHYLRSGSAEGRDPNPRFDGRWYLAANPFVRESGLNALAHYLRVGARAGRASAPSDDEGALAR